jgi:cysteine-rich repeat protein
MAFKAWLVVTTLFVGMGLVACGDDTSSTTGTTAGQTTSSSGSGGQGGTGGSAPACGDGALDEGEVCDDGNTAGADGCSPACGVEEGFECAGEPSACDGICGDGLVVGSEMCDDGNAAIDDGCGDACAIEDGYACTGAPSACDTICGDGLLIGNESCDDGNTASDDGCADTCSVEGGYDCTGEPSACVTICGDGLIAGDEACDDGGSSPDDGCDAACAIEAGWACVDQPSVCTTGCGDGIIAGVEACDDGDPDGGDGCSAACVVEAGYDCTGAPSVCVTICGDGDVAGAEACDDGDLDGGDGCSAACVVEVGFTCVGQPSVCAGICGDSLVRGAEGCDDGNTMNGDGCTATCLVQTGYACAGEPSACDTVCGDGIKLLSEACDDGNVVDGDCCSATCTVEAGCEVESNGTAPTANDFAALAINDAVRGEVRPAQDRDFYAITVPAGSMAVLTAQTSDGWSSTCASFALDSELTLYDSALTVITNNDDAGGSCSSIAAPNLTGGVYYIEVRASDSLPFLQFNYTLTTGLIICGDGVMEGAEECDDGNLMNGDGCDATCEIEVPTEVEPNGTAATASGPFAPEIIIEGAIGPIGDQDYYAITIPATADLRIETFDANGPVTCAGIDTLVDLYAPNGTTLLVNDDDDGVDACSLVNSVVDAGARHIPAGTYYVHVNDYLNDGLIPGYTLQITYNALCGDGVIEGGEECDGGPTCDAGCDRIPICGDGFIDAPEFCDDSNTNDGDGCSSACQIEGAEVEVEPNGTLAQADASTLQVSSSTFIVGSISPVADLDLFRLQLAASSVVRFETFDTTLGSCAGGMTTTLRVLNSVGGLIASDTTTGINSCSALVLNLAAGTYYVEVTETGNNAAISAYSVEVAIQSSSGAEIEANETQATATALPGTNVFMFGGHMVAADVDYFAITVPPGGSVRAEVIEGGAETCESNGVDSQLRLFNDAAVQLVTDNDDGRGFCSQIDGTGAVGFKDAGAHNLAGGTYYLQVTGFGAGAGAVFDYRLQVTIRSP